MVVSLMKAIAQTKPPIPTDIEPIQPNAGGPGVQNTPRAGEPAWQTIRAHKTNPGQMSTPPKKKNIWKFLGRERNTPPATMFICGGLLLWCQAPMFRCYPDVKFDY